MINRITFIDANIAEYASLVSQLPAGSEVIVLDSKHDGVLQILAALQGKNELDAIDILSHGKPGALLLGSGELNHANLEYYAQPLQQIGSCMRYGGDILLYGCEVGQGKTGRMFIEQLAQLTGANVAASASLTGAADLGGDWVLEAQAGRIQASTLKLSFQGILAIITGSSGNDDIEGSTGDDTIDGAAGNDKLWSNSGNDLLIGGAGNDLLIGNSGSDIAVFSGNQTGYEFSLDATGRITVKDIDLSNGDDGTDTLLGIETFRFADGDIQNSTNEYQEFKVSSYYENTIGSSNNFLKPSVTGLNTGGFVIAYEYTGKYPDIRAQQFDSNGIAEGGDFLVNTYTDNWQENPAIAALKNGGFVVTWESYQDGSKYGIYAQRYDTNGVAQGVEFRINSNTDKHQQLPAITALSDGGFVVVWYEEVAANDHEIDARRYDSNGIAQGGEFNVNTYTLGYQFDPSIAGLKDGGFIVAWTSTSQDGNGDGVYAQRYDSNGLQVGIEFQVNTHTNLHQSRPSVAALSNGGFVVTYESNGLGSDDDIYAKLYDSGGTPIGGEFRVNTHTPAHQFMSSVTGLNTGGFVVVWQSTYQDDSSGMLGIYGQRYDANGVAQGGEFLVNTYTKGDQTTPSVTALSDGGFVVSWAYNNSGGIYAQRYDSEGRALGGEVTLTGDAADNRLNMVSALAFPVKLSGMGGNDELRSGTDKDTLDGGDGSDTLIGGLGDDSYTIDNTGDVITENLNEGTDSVASSITYTLPSNVENLTLTGALAINGTGNNLANVITGNTANNTLNGGTGADTLIGGLGNDTYTVDNIGDVVTENLNEGTDKINSSVSYTLSANVENLTLIGSSAIDGTGNDLANSLIGNTASNVLTGGAGNDRLDGKAGADTLIGGLDNDTYTVDNAGDSITEDLNEGIDKINSSVTYTLSANVENLTLTGSSIIDGTGNNLANTLIGNTAANQLDGRSGNDTLDGGLGNNVLTGGTGKDTFKITTSGHVDTITDYNVADDTIKLENAVFTALTTTGTLPASQFKVGSSAADADDYIIYNNITGALLYDADGSGLGAAVQIATLTGGLAMTNADIVVI